MPTLLPTAHCWRTSLPPAQSERPAHNLSGLDDHLALCRGQGGRLFAMRCMAETTHGLLAARFVSTVVAVGTLILAATLVA